MTDMRDWPKLTPGAAYRNFDDISIKIQCWVQSLPLRVDLCDETQVKQRVVQKIVEELNPTFIDSLKRHKVQEESEDPGGKLRHKYFSLDTRTGKVKLSSVFFAYQISIFLYFWCGLLIHCILKLCTSKRRKTVSATFLFEAGGGYEEDDTRFLDFCAKGPVRPLGEAERLVVFSRVQPAKQNDSENVIYCEEPLVGYFGSFMSKTAQLGFLVSHLRAPLILFKMLIRNPILVVAARDCAYLPAYAFLNSKKLLKDVIITNSRFPAQFLWMKGLKKQCYRLHMLWYSQNFIPKQYIGEELDSNLPSARHIRVDVHWVWTPGFKKYLQELGQENEVHVVGPLLWYLNTTSEPSPLPGEYSVVLFDVTPVNSGSNVFATVFNYYSFETISKFVENAISACGYLSGKYGVKIMVYLKHKRAFRSVHDLRYIDYISRLSQEVPDFYVLDSDINLFELIGASDLSVAVPYTSTAYVSSAMGKKAIYYDAAASLVPSYEVSEFVLYAGNYLSLLNAIETSLFAANKSYVV